MKRILAATTSSAGTNSNGSADLGSAHAPASEANANKRMHLETMLESARASGLAQDLITHIQAELDALPALQGNSQLQEAGRLYQEKAKQEKHFASQGASLDLQVDNIRKQREQLDALEKQLATTRQELEAQHAINMERIDAAINVRVSAHGPAPGEAPASSLASSATTAQVLSATLGTAVNDMSFFTNVPPDHQAAIRSFCLQVTSHFASDQTPAASSPGPASSPVVLGTSSAESGTSMDMNPHNFVGLVS